MNVQKGLHPNMMWVAIKEDLELKIIQGDISAGDRMLSITELADMYDVSKSTAQKVLESMAEEDVLVKRRGIGFFVKPYMKDYIRQKHIDKLKNLINDVSEYAGYLSLTDEELQKLEKIINESIQNYRCARG